MKTVFLKSRFKNLPLHALYDELVKEPPENYKILTQYNVQKHPLTTSVSKSHNYYYKQFLYHFGALPYLLAQQVESSIKYKDHDLIYASQHVISTKTPWVVDCEFCSALTSYFDPFFCKNIIAKKLESSSCKAIMPWSDWAAKTLQNLMDCKNLKEKIKVVRYTVPSKNIKNKIKKSGIQIFFLGSMNPANVKSFEFKGIYEIIDAFIELQKKYDNLELIVRSLVSPEIKKKTSKFSNIKILEKPISSEELEKLYLTSDIFVHPGFEVLNLSILEAMSYGIPVIATSLYNTPELIKHMHNGILIDLANPKLFYTKYDTPNDFSKSFMNSMIKLRPYMTQKLVEFMGLLIEDSSIRLKIGKEAHSTIEKGEFSIKNRNKLLKEIFDNATS